MGGERAEWSRVWELHRDPTQELFEWNSKVPKTNTKTPNVNTIKLPQIYFFRFWLKVCALERRHLREEWKEIFLRVFRSPGFSSQRPLRLPGVQPVEVYFIIILENDIIFSKGISGFWLKDLSTIFKQNLFAAWIVWLQVQVDKHKWNTRGTAQNVAVWKCAFDGIEKMSALQNGYEI